MPSLDALEDVFRQRLNIFGAVAEGRDHDPGDIEAVVEILAESAGRNLFGEVAVSGRDDTRIRTQSLSPTDALEFILLQNPKDLDLGGEWELAHFIEKNCACRRSLETSGLLAVGAGEAHRVVAEELALDEPFGKSTTVDTDEWSAGAIGVTMKRGGDQLLAGAAFAKDQDRRIGGGGHTDRS